MLHGKHSIAKSVIFVVFAGSIMVRLNASERSIIGEVARVGDLIAASGKETREASVLAGRRAGIFGAAGGAECRCTNRPPYRRSLSLIWTDGSAWPPYSGR
jgi:hypothetical protein